MAKEAIMAVRWIETAPSRMICCSRRPLSKTLETIVEEPSMDDLPNVCSRQPEEEAKNQNTEAASNFLNNFDFRRKWSFQIALLEWRQVFRVLFAIVLASGAKILRRHPQNKLNFSHFDFLWLGSGRSQLQDILLWRG